MVKKYNYNQDLRMFKGRSLLEIPIDYTVIDVETTDFHFFYGDIIEVGAVKVRNNQIVDQYSELLKLHTKLPPYITEITGITNEMLQNARNPYDVISDFFSFIGNDVLVAHNANFDINFLYDLHVELELPPLSNDFVDTLRLSRRVHKDFANHKLDTLCEFYNIERIGHRSLSDCISTLQVYSELYRNILNNEQILSSKKKGIIAPNERIYKIDLQSVLGSLDVTDEDNYFFNKSICFTGRMDYLTKYEAAQLIEKLGAVPCSNVNKNTNLLVLGNLQYQQETYGDKSNKHKKVESLIADGFDIEILTESDFLEIIKQYYSII